MMFGGKRREIGWEVVKGGGGDDDDDDDWVEMHETTEEIHIEFMERCF